MNRKLKGKRLVKAVRKVFVDDMVAVPINRREPLGTPSVKTVNYAGKQMVVRKSFTILCVNCGGTGIYVDRRSRYSECSVCGHVVTTIR